MPQSVLQVDPPEELPKAWAQRVRLEEKLGGGAFGAVYRAKAACDLEDSHVSVKVMHQANRRSQYREVKLLRMMKDEDFVVSTVGKPDHVDTAEGMWIMMPYLNGGSLRKPLRLCREEMLCKHPAGSWQALGSPYTLSFMLALFYQVLQGVKSIHSKGLIHMDIKPDNIMVNCGKTCAAYVVDLGIACKIGECKPSGTPGFISPEVWAEGEVTAGNDVFALGVVRLRSHILEKRQLSRLYNIVYRTVIPFFWDRDGKVTRSYTTEKAGTTGFQP